MQLKQILYKKGEHLVDRMQCWADFLIHVGGRVRLFHMCVPPGLLQRSKSGGRTG